VSVSRTRQEPLELLVDSLSTRRYSPMPPRRPAHAPEKPEPSQTLGVFGLSVRTRERDLDYEFGRYGTVESVHIVYDQRVRIRRFWVLYGPPWNRAHLLSSRSARQSERSRGFGFIRMGSVDEAALCIEKLNGIDLNGRRIRVDFSVTSRPHDPTPGAYMGPKRPECGCCA
jgi:transformer-2 protein